MAVAKRQGAQAIRRPLRRWGLILLLFVLVLAGVYVWYRYRERQAAEQVTYTTVSVTPAAFDLTISGPGTLESSRSVSVSSSVAGTIETIPAVGDSVEEGQVLVTLETTELEQAVSSAQLALEQAQAEQASLSSSQDDSATSLATDIASAQRTVAEDERALKSSEDDLALAKRLEVVGSESGVNVTAAQNAYDTAAAALQGSQDALATLQASASLQSEGNAQNLRNAELTVQSAQLALASAQRDLESATLTAPMAGVITRISDEESGGDTETATVIQAGTTINEGQTILTLSNYSTINLIAQVDETQISDVHVDQAATVEVDALEDQTFDGTVTAVSPSAEVEDNIPVFEVTVTIDNPDQTLRPGMSAEAQIAVETIEKTLSVPVAAVQSRGEGTFVALEQGDENVLVPVDVVGSDGLNSVVQIAEAPAGEGALSEGAPSEGAPGAGATAEGGSTGAEQNRGPGAGPNGATPPDFSTLLESAQAVTVRVPSTTTAPVSGEAGGPGGPGGGGFGGPPGGGF